MCPATLTNVRPQGTDFSDLGSATRDENARPLMQDSPQSSAAPKGAQTQDPAFLMYINAAICLEDANKDLFICLKTRPIITRE